MAKFVPDTLKEINIEFLKKPYVFVFPENQYKIHRQNEFFDHLDRWTNSYAFPVTKGPEAYKKVMDIFFNEEEYMPILETHIYILKLIIDKLRKINKPIYFFKLDLDPILWDKVIKPNIEKELDIYDNVYFLWEK